jgi:hypothetical protein
MELEEAKDILENVVADEVVGIYCKEIQKETDCSKNCEKEDCFIQQAIDTVIAELHALQNLLDEKNEEIEHLQKENEEYSKQMDLDYVDKNFVSREKIENKIKEYFEYDKKHKTYTSDGRENYTYEYYKALTLQDLLREE